MKQTLTKLWQKVKVFAERHRRTIIGIAIALGVVVAIVWLIALDRRYNWTGWGAIDNPSYSEQPRFLWGKSVWGWLDLLLVPVVLAVAGLLFNRSERKAEREIADRRIEEDRRIAAERTQEARLQSYLDKMTELMLEKGLRTSEPGAEVRDITRARTLTALRSLDGARKALLLRFLYESGLTGPRMVVRLSGADLTKADLTMANLHEANLHEANLSWAYLDGADLRGANLSGTNLDGALLSEANLSGADLRGANLSVADLSGANLSEALLSEVALLGTNLTNLGEADLSLTNLTGADLRGAKVTEEQLAQARSLQGATMPDGTVHE